jgi:DNA replication protein DnaC
LIKEEEAERERQEHEAATKRQRDRISQAKIPELWRDTTFETSDPSINRVAFNRCRRYAETFDPKKSPSLYLFSLKYGAGKTHLAACIANYVLLEKKYSVRYQKARDLLLDIRRTYSDRGDVDEAGLLDNVLSFNLLILDDVGIDQPSQWLVSTYWTVLDRRMEMGLPVVVTANYNLFETERGMTIGDRIGFGAESRLRKMCGENVIEFKGKDLR